MHTRIVTALKDSHGKDISGNYVPMPEGSQHVVSEFDVPWFLAHPDVFSVGEAYQTRGAALSADLNALEDVPRLSPSGALVGADGRPALELKNTGIRIFDGRIAGSSAVDGTSGTTYAAVFTLAEVPDAVWPIFANGGTADYVIAAMSACAVSESNLNGNSSTITAGVVTGADTVLARPASNRASYLLGNRMLIQNPSASKMVQIRAHIAAGAGTITVMGNGSDNWTNWATRAGLVHVFRNQTGNQTASAGAFTSTTNVSVSPIIGVMYAARGRVVTVMATGDSIDSGRGTYLADSPVYQALRSGSRSHYAVEFANAAWAGASPNEFKDQLLDLCAAGVVPDYVVGATGSPNGITSSIPDSALITWRWAQAALSAACAKYGVRLVLRTMICANSSSDTPSGVENWGADDAKRRAYNASLLAGNIPCLDWDSIASSGAPNGNGQTPFAAGMTDDATHPNDACNAALAAYMAGTNMLP